MGSVTAGGDMLVDEVLRYDRLEEDWCRFARKYGIEGSLGHHNGSNRDRDYRPYYTPESREIVREYYREDIEVFGYEFQ